MKKYCILDISPIEYEENKFKVFIPHCHYSLSNSKFAYKKNRFFSEDIKKEVEGNPILDGYLVVGFKDIPTDVGYDMDFFLKAGGDGGSFVEPTCKELVEHLTQKGQPLLTVLRTFLCFCEFDGVPSLKSLASMAEMSEKCKACVAYMVLDWAGMDASMKKIFEEYVVFFREHSRNAL